MDKPGKDHFSEHLWSDFARGIAPAEQLERMQAHLDSGCDACRETARLLGWVARTGAQDSALIVPQDEVNEAVALFAQGPSAAWIEKLVPLVAELVSSVSQDWQFAGMRAASSVSGAQRMLFRAGDYAVDLELEPPLAAEPGRIVGQILSRPDLTAGPARQMEGILVLLLGGGRTLGQTSTNQFGEFLLDHNAYRSATLRFAMKQQGQRIDLPLKLGN